MVVFAREFHEHDEVCAHKSSVNQTKGNVSANECLRFKFLLAFLGFFLRSVLSLFPLICAKYIRWASLII